MKDMADNVKTIEWTAGGVALIDQRLLPGKEEYRLCRSYQEVAEAISGLSKINDNYPQQRQAARQIAEDFFSTKKVLPRLLEAAMR